MADAEDYLCLKWGTLKGWRFSKPESQALMQRFIDSGMKISAMAQRNTPEQKQIICDLIRSIDGPIQNDWTGEYYTKDQAVEYVMSYGRDIA